MSDTVHLPVLDLLNSEPDVGERLVQTVAQYGFVYVKSKGTGIRVDEVEAMFSLAQDFFKSPIENKTKCAVNSKISGKNSGWFGMNVERLDPAKQKIKRGDFKEAFNMNEFLDGKAQQPLPAPLASHESYMNDFIDRCHALCIRILELFAIGLGIAEPEGGKDWFSSRHDRTKGSSGSVFRLLYYPKIDLDGAFEAEKDTRAGAHSDYGTITLLFQKEGQPGLEILTDSETNAWKPVAVNPTGEAEVPILVNVGDLLSYWTNGLLKSTVHRVVFPQHGAGDDRYSIAYFCHPLDQARLEPVPSKMVQECKHEEGPSHGNAVRGAITAKEHLEYRLNATYR